MDQTIFALIVKIIFICFTYWLMWDYIQMLHKHTKDMKEILAICTDCIETAKFSSSMGMNVAECNVVYEKAFAQLTSITSVGQFEQIYKDTLDDIAEIHSRQPVMPDCISHRQGKPEALQS